MVKKFLYFGVSRLFIFAGQLLLIPIAVTQLGTAGYGLYNLMLQGTLLLRLVAVQGVSHVLVRDSSRLTAENGESGLYSAGLYIIVASLVLLMLVIIPLKPIIMSTFHLSNGQIWLITAMAIAVSFFSLKQTLVYCKSVSAYVVSDAVQILGTTFAVVLAGLFIPTAEAYALAFALVTLLIALAMRGYSGGSRPRWKIVRELLVGMRGYGLPLMLWEGLSWFVGIAGRFQVDAMLNLEQTGIYIAACQLFVAPGAMIGFAVAQVIQPTTFASDTNSYRSKMEQSATAVIMLSLLYAVPMLLFGRQIFAIFFRHRAKAGFLLVALLVLTGLASGFLFLEGIAGKYARSPKAILVAQAFAAVLILVGNWILLPRIGIIAAAMTALAAYLLQIIIIRISIKEEFRFRYLSLAAAKTVYHKAMAGVAGTLGKG